MDKKFFFISILPILFTVNSTASKLVETAPVDNQCLVIHWQDGNIQYNWDDTICGSCNGWNYYYTENWHLCPDKDQYIPFGKPLNTAVAKQTGSYILTSEDDGNYGSAGKSPVNVYRKSKVWEASHDERKPAMHHWMYLDLPLPLQRGKQYTLKIDAGTNSGEALKLFTF